MMSVAIEPICAVSWQIFTFSFEFSESGEFVMSSFLCWEWGVDLWNSAIPTISQKSHMLKSLKAVKERNKNMFVTEPLSRSSIL